MALKEANGTSMVPEKYRKNRFVMAAWYVINTMWETKGKWPTYKDFQRIAQGPDRNCHENVFDDVLRELKLDETLHPRKIHEVDENAPDSVIPPAHELYQKDATSKIGDALAAGIDKSAKGEKKAPRPPVDAARRAQARSWIQEHLDEGWAAFNHGFPEPDFDTSWWQKTRNGFLHPKEEENSMPVAVEFDPRVKGITQKVTHFCLTLENRPRIEGLGFQDFLAKSRLKVKYHEFKKGRELALRHLANGGALTRTAAPAPTAAPAARAEVAAPAAATATAGPPARLAKGRRSSSFELLGQVDMGPFDKLDKETLYKFALTLTKTLAPDRETEVVMLAYPPALEIRAII